MQSAEFQAASIWMCVARRLSETRSGRSLQRMNATPNPSLKRSANGRPPGPGLCHAELFSQPGPWRPAVVARLARTLGSAGEAVQCSSRVSACRRELNSHDAAEPRILGGLPRNDTQGPSAKGKPTEQPSKIMSRGTAKRNDKAPPCQLASQHCVGGLGFQSVRGAAASSTAVSSRSPLRRRLESVAGRGLQRGAGGDCGAPTGVTRHWQPNRQHSSSERCLTPRSSGAPTAGHQARAGGTRYIFASPGLASCRRRPLSSNVRQRNRKNTFATRGR